MSRHERLSTILGIIVDEGSVHIDDIIERLGVSAATARRDLDLLANQQLVTRTRGGANANPTSAELPLRYRTSRMAQEKGRIARAAAAMVGPGDCVGLNGGTTTTEIAREIALLPGLTDPDNPVTVITNAVNIASELTVRQCVRVVVTGGVARARSYELTGPLTELILPSITVGTLFLGVEGIDERGTYAQHEGEAAVNAALARTARRVVVVCDHTKLGATAFALICRAADIDLLITDDGAPADQVQALRAAGIEVLLV
ncbi:DeoR/GlpR transcriptional regulator [Actinomyces bowdenii]|uniref:DeoR/GlpR transcriptional regulator n=1 Tax=Actinomyces bowdenii TaxID=131109 RepID=A0A3P1UUY1_9ACTO|nr:DeoR/GlpR family DNA-binding transcription regulator [Actinomyces bowdenii]MBO3723933.1 DeoR/GlpR transcriptional regulator [Actinomyces bowdenii]RRD25632.1 DeoR/GlpR transcriptional regulator [Actinomyces bowdenii]